MSQLLIYFRKDIVMDSLKEVRKRMQDEIDKGRATPMKFEKMVLDETSYKAIMSEEKLKEVLNYLLRLSEYRTGMATVMNNVYLDLRKPIQPPQFCRTKSVMERMLIDMGALKQAKKIAPFYDGDCVIEEAKCYFSVPKDVIEKCRMKYKGEDAYGLILSNTFIMGLHCICEAARAEYAVDMTVTEADAMYMKAMALLNIKEVIFQCLLLDDVKEVDGMIVASLYTIYVLE